MVNLTAPECGSILASDIFLFSSIRHDVESVGHVVVTDTAKFHAQHPVLPRFIENVSHFVDVARHRLRLKQQLPGLIDNTEAVIDVFGM
jgi:hypothetical protein